MSAFVILMHVLSFLSFSAGVFCLFYKRRTRRARSRLALMTVCLFAAIGFLSLCGIGADGDVNPSLRFAFFPRTIQAFSVDTDYEEAFAFPAGFESPAWRTLLNLYRILLYSAAPIVGGAVIYDALAGVSPGLRLFMLRRRRMFVFSELNPRSLCLAESIHRDAGRGRRPVLVFTGGEPGDGDGGVALMSRARRLRAVCLPEEMSACNGFRRARECVFFLMSLDGDGYDDLKNLGALEGMLRAERCVWPRARGCQLFCFTDSAAMVESIRAAKAAYDAGSDGARGRVALHVIRDYAQVANALMTAHPLYEVLEGRGEGAPLKVLVIGNNALSREMFKAAFWCGQMLDHPLKLGAVAAGEADAEGPTAFERWLTAACPELMESCVEGADCLRRSLAGDCNPPYAELYFAEVAPEALCGDAFLDETRARRFGMPGEAALAEFDYVIAAPGGDAENIRLAESLWRQCAYGKLRDGAAGKRVIAVAIRDDALARLTRQRYAALGARMDAAALVVFGDDAARFDWRNVFRSDPCGYDGAAESSAEDAMHSLPEMDVTKDDIYNEWSGQTRRVHLSYKMYSALGRRPADHGDAEAFQRDRTDWAEALQNDPALVERLSWLEHRRWNAFMRTQGFRRPPRLEETLRRFAEGCCDDRDEGALAPYAYKTVPARLHPDLVEAAAGARADPADLLDLASDLRDLVDAKAGKERSGFDIKFYDRPEA